MLMSGCAVQASWLWQMLQDLPVLCVGNCAFPNVYAPRQILATAYN